MSGAKRKRKSHPKRKKDEAGLENDLASSTSVARLMEIGDNRSAYLTMRQYRGRTQTPDRRLLIDCTNLQDVLQHGKGPLVAVCLDGNESSQWISCVLGFLHPRLILLQVCLFPFANLCKEGQPNFRLRLSTAARCSGGQCHNRPFRYQPAVSVSAH